MEGEKTAVFNIESNRGRGSATELSGNGDKGQAAKDALMLREREEEEEDKRMEERRVERQAERSIHKMLQDSKAERDLEKQIQAEDDLVQEEEDNEIEEELDEIYEENPRVKEVIKGKSYWNKPLPGGLKPSGQTYKSSQIRSEKEIKIYKGPVPQP